MLKRKAQYINPGIYIKLGFHIFIGGGKEGYKISACRRGPEVTIK